MAKLTSRALASGATLDDLIHIVITGDTTQDPLGSSYKATLGQLAPLFVSNPDLVITGGTSNSSGGTLTLTNSTGGTVTISGLTTPFTGGSGNCITDFYVTNVYGCSPITIHSEVQTSGATATGVLSYSLGLNTTTLGDFSLSQGWLSKTGSDKWFFATGCTSGVVSLDSTYGDVTPSFPVGLTDAVLLNDDNYLNNLLVNTSTVSAATFNGSNTVIYLNNTTIDTLGGSLLITPSTQNPATWTGDQIFGGLYGFAANSRTFAIGRGASSFGSGSALGDLSFAEGVDSMSYGRGSHAEGNSSKSIGECSHAQNTSNFAVGDNSHAGGNHTIVLGLNSFGHALNTTVVGNNSAAFGDFGSNYSAYSDNSVYVPNLIIAKSYTPSGTTDTGGESGSITWDNDYLYYKTDNGWFRLTGSTF